jgi:sugar lactone lactonase YvrE
MTTKSALSLHLLLFPLALLASSAPAADTLKFSESLRQAAENGAAVEQGRISATARLSLAGVDASGFDANTSFEIYVGAFHFAATLGGDPRYAPGKTGAQFSANGLSAQLSWNAKELSVAIGAATPSANHPALADTLLGFPGPIQTNVLASVNFAGVSDQFVLATSGRVVLKNGLSSAVLSGSGLGTTAAPPGPTRTLAQGQFHVDATTGQVTVGTSGGDVASFHKDAKFTGSTITFNSSALLSQGGDMGRRVLDVSLTNRSGEPIGALPGGAVTGSRVLFSPFTNVASFTLDLRSQTTVSTFAGSGASGSADGADASATFNFPDGVAVDGSGTVYIADGNNNKIRKISNGFVSTLAGGGAIGAVNGIGTAAGFNDPSGIALNPVDGALIVAELFGHRVRRVTPDGRVATVAGTGVASGVNGLGSAATFVNPFGVAVDSAGTIYVTEQLGNRIRKITLKAGADPTLPANYTVSTLAGSSTGLTGSTDGVGIAAKFNHPEGIAVTADGTLYVADASNFKIRRVSKAGEVVTIAGTGAAGSTDGAGNAATFSRPVGIVLVNGALVVSDENAQNIRQLTLQDGANPSSATSWRVATIAGIAGSAGSADGRGDVATFFFPLLLAADAAGSLYIPDAVNNKIRKVVPASGFFPVGAPNGNAAGEPVQLANADGVIPNQGAGVNLPFIKYAQSLANGATSAVQPWVFVIPSEVGAFEFTATIEANTSFLAPPFAVDNSATPGSGAGSPLNDVRTLAGPTAFHLGYIDGTAGEARFSEALGIAVDANGNAYVADFNNNAIRRISADGIVSTVAGDVGNGSSGSVDGAGNVARFSDPPGIATSPDGSTLYVTDYSNHTVRRITFGGGDPANPANWTVSTIAGTVGTAGSINGTGDVARFNAPYGIAIDTGGNLYVTENSGNRVRRLQFKGGDPSRNTNWQVTLVAGDNAFTTGASGDLDGTSGNARFSFPKGIVVDRAGNVYVADSGNSRIRRITPDGVVTTFAGGVSGDTPTAGYLDSPTGSIARFNSPAGIAIDSAGYLYVADPGNLRVRRISPGGAVETVAGNGTSNFVDGTGDVAEFAVPLFIAADTVGNLYVTDDDVSVRLIQRAINSAGP